MNMKMSAINEKISWPLLAAFLGAAVGALSGQFVWALIAAFGLWAVAYIAQNLTAIFQRANSAQDQSTLVKANDAVSMSIEKGHDWLQKLNEDMDYCPTYKGSPGNIWNAPKWTRHD